MDYMLFAFIIDGSHCSTLRLANIQNSAQERVLLDLSQVNRQD